MPKENGAFRSKKGWTAVDNELIRDTSVSLKAKGLYLMIQSYITIPDFSCTKAFLLSNCQEGQKAFDAAWNELKDAGYLKVHFHVANRGRNTFVSEYELLDKCEPGPHTFYYDAAGNLTKTNETKGNLRTPRFGSNANGDNADGTYADGRSAKSSDGNGYDANGGDNNKTDPKTLNSTRSIHPSNERDKGMMDDEESVRDFYDWDSWQRDLEDGSSDVTPAAVEALLDTMQAVFDEPRESYRIAGRDVPAKDVLARLRSLKRADIEAAADGILHRDPDTPVRNPYAYMLSSLYNAPASRLSAPVKRSAGKAGGRMTSFHNFEERASAGGSWDELEQYHPAVRQDGPEVSSEETDDDEQWKQLLATLRTGKKRA